MASRLRSQSWGILAVLASLLLIAVAIGVVTRWGSKIPGSDDYAPNDRVMNCFDAKEIGEPLVVCPEGNLFVGAGFRKLTWVTHWDDRSRTAVIVQDLDFGERVVAAVFSGDGRRLAVFARSPAEDVIAVFDARTRELLNKWPAPRSIYDPTLRLSHDGAVLAMNTVEPVNRAENLDAVTVWDTSTGKLVSSIATSKDSSLTDFVLHQGRMLLAYHGLPEYKELSIYESAAPYTRTALVRSIKAPGATVFDSGRFSADGTRLAVACHHARPMKVYAVSDGHVIAAFDKAYYGVSTTSFPGFVFSADGKFVAASNTGGSVCLLSVGSAKEICTFEGHRYDGMHELVFGPDNGTLISIDSRAVVAWNIRDLVNQNR
jgi:WD40 repeat protein